MLAIWLCCLPIRRERPAPRLVVASLRQVVHHRKLASVIEMLLGERRQLPQHRHLAWPPPASRTNSEIGHGRTAAHGRDPSWPLLARGDAPHLVWTSHLGPSHTIATPQDYTPTCAKAASTRQRSACDFGPMSGATHLVHQASRTLHDGYRPKADPTPPAQQTLVVVQSHRAVHGQWNHSPMEGAWSMHAPNVPNKPRVGGDAQPEHARSRVTSTLL
ncbi:hypothetical protein H310_08734 [Aphanomyces invadans]|uniref:Uncharacterized protein n=1 Tax=Aphanomyces invadans TaxID=157072 RepID=A0A024TYA0_9STRA|nr:hypothetical protein H310_08734 [Aphanomyces invadans]ETV98616.1 hypothetical protein H310_08734 [Aphanomyces invadans]|eukprot:XP_008872813.1 hypothetical protein H310_08734 [Aphanomyces invadans]